MIPTQYLPSFNCYSQKPLRLPPIRNHQFSNPIPIRERYIYPLAQRPEAKDMQNNEPRQITTVPFLVPILFLVYIPVHACDA
jgi:hypothetical protein